MLKPLLDSEQTTFASAELNEHGFKLMYIFFLLGRKMPPLSDPNTEERFEESEIGRPATALASHQCGLGLTPFRYACDGLDAANWQLNK